MSRSIQVTGWVTEGVTLLSPEDRGFDAVVGSLFQGNTRELLKLKPFLTVVTNRTERTIVAYTVHWQVTLPEETRSSYSQHKYPDAVGGEAPARGNEINPGERKIVAMDIEIDCGRWGGIATEEFYLRQFADWFREFREATQVEIALDAVIFGDGELIGADATQIGDHFAAYVKAKQDLYRLLVDSLDSGRPLDEAFRPIEAIVAAEAANRGKDSRNPLAMWGRVAAPEVRGWRMRYGDQALPDILRRALRQDAFVVGRKGR